MRILMTMVLIMVSSAQALAAELTVLASVAARDYIDEMVPEWKASTGNMLFIEYNSGAEVRKKVNAGATFDVVISFAPDLEGMRKALQVETEGSMIGTAYLVIVYKRGTEAPEAATPDQFKALIESMPSFATSDPAGGGVGPVLVVDTAQRMGVQETLKAKMVLVKSGQAAIAVAEGRARFGIAQTTEIARVPDVEGSKFLPGDPRSTTRLAAAVGTKSLEKSVAENFIAFVTSPATLQTRRAAGFETH